MANPTRGQMLLPLLQALRDAGGSSTPKRLYGEVADRMGLTSEERGRTFESRGRPESAFARDLRWLRQSSVQKGTMASGGRGRWTLTDDGMGKLLNAAGGVLITIFETGLGRAVWGRAEAAIGSLDDGSVDLVMTSPPYPGTFKAYENGMTLDEASWVDWMMDMIGGLEAKLTPTGSMMLNVGETYHPGSPHKGEHLSRLRVRLADETRWKVLDTLYWSNSSKLPSPFGWVASRRIRLKPSVEPIIWLGTDPIAAKADNRRVLRPYGGKMLRNLDGSRPFDVGTSERPSGHRLSATGWTRDNGGSIAPHLLECGASGGNRSYYAGARSEGLPLHPAVMPQKVAEFAIRLTTDAGDSVLDPLAGSLTTAAAAERLGRRWIASDCSLAYLAGGRHRFPQRTETESLRAHLEDAA